MEETKPVEEKPDPQAKDKKAPGREKQPEGSKRLTVMVAGVPHGIEVQPGSVTEDVLLQVHAVGKKLSKAEGGTGHAFGLTDKIFEYVNDTDTLYVT
jgi:hypothetical protein